jgi:hypothetical protein
MSTADRSLPRDKQDLEQQIDAARAALEAVFDTHDETQLTEVRDDAGWSARDHLHHIAAWEDFEIARERGAGAYAIFGLPDKASYDALVAREPDFRAINEQVRQHGKDLSLAAVRAYARQSRATAKALLATFTDEGLRRLSNPADPTSDTFMAIVAGNSYEHDDEHRSYIEALLERGA